MFRSSILCSIEDSTLTLLSCILLYAWDWKYYSWHHVTNALGLEYMSKLATVRSVRFLVNLFSWPYPRWRACMTTVCQIHLRRFGSSKIDLAHAYVPVSPNLCYPQIIDNTPDLRLYNIFYGNDVWCIVNKCFGLQ